MRPHLRLPGPGRVAVARRNLFEDRRRALLALGGIGAGLLMVMLMSGVFVGMTKQETAYIDGSAADVFVAQEGVRTLQMSTTSLPADTVAEVRSVPGVAWAEALRHTTTIVAAGDTKMITYLFGYDTASGRGGPRQLVAGREPVAGEVVVDQTGADQLHLGVGDSVAVFGQSLRISGLSHGLTGMGNTTMFVTQAQFATMLGPAVNWVLVGAEPGVDPAALAARVQATIPHTTAQTRAGFAGEQARAIEDLYLDVIRTMMLVGFVIALALVGLTLSTVTASHLREYGVVKALGGTARRLAGVVVSQALWAISAALILASLLAYGLAAAIGHVLPNILVVIEPSAVLITAIGAFVIGVPAALVPLRRVARVDPASAFRGAA